MSNRTDCLNGTCYKNAKTNNTDLVSLISQMEIYSVIKRLHDLIPQIMIREHFREHQNLFYYDTVQLS
jgi:hypothetical protein